MAKDQAVCDCDVIHEDILKKVLGEMPADTVFSKLTDFFKILSDISRVKILWGLCCNELCVCDLAALLNMSKSAISHKLKDLRLGKMVDYRKEGRIVFYFISNIFIKELFKETFKVI
jgi:ArsR family transcriptional regulator